MPPRRLLCARYPHLGLLAVWRRHPELRGEAVVITGPGGGVAAEDVGSASGPGGRPRVLAVSPAAAAAGVRAGQQLLRVGQLCPGAVRLGVDVAVVAALREAALAALCALAPSVELGDEEAWCDLSGSHAAFGEAAHARDTLPGSCQGGPTLDGSSLRGEPAWAAAVARALTDALGGEAPSVGVASTRFTAWMAARQAVPRRVRRVRPGEEAAFLAPLPLALLPLDAAVVGRLGALGLDRIGQVAGLAPADLRRQFGAAGEVAARYARGRDDLPLAPHSAPREIVERVVLDGPATDLEVLRRCAELACRRLGGRLEERGLGTGLLDLTLEAEDGMPVRGERRPPIAAGGAGDLWPAVLGLLAGVRVTAPVIALRLAAGALEPAGGRQVDLWRRGDAARDAVAVAAARLGDRFGPRTVLRPRLALDPGDLPERRFRWEVGSAGPPGRMPTRRVPVAAGR